VTAPKKPASRERVMQVKDPSLEKGELRAFAGVALDGPSPIWLFGQPSH
jgi:hypothetical protein